MIRNLFAVAFRSLNRYRVFAVINVVGLTLGIACALFIFLICQFELSYDRYHKSASRIYRINAGGPGQDFDHDMGTPEGIAPALRDEFPEVEKVAVAYKLNPERTQVKINNVLSREQEIYFVEPDFFAMLDFNWKQGDPATALNGPSKVVITESLARKYFNGDALGKGIQLNNEKDLIVTGIIEDPPLNSDFPLGVIVSYATYTTNNPDYNPKQLEGWNSYHQTYVLLREGSDVSALPPKFKALVERRISKEAAEKLIGFSAQPLNDIHFHIGNFSKRLISQTTILSLQLIGLFIVVIACINFINLASSQAIKRSKEVGIRKTLGSSRNSLILQFLGETFVITSVALVFSVVIVMQLASWSHILTDIPLDPAAVWKPGSLIFMASLLIGVTLLSGFYPAFVLSGFRPAQALKSALPAGSKGMILRKGLIAFQFVISQVLIVCTLIVVRQTDYFNSMPLGFNKEAVLTADIPVPDAGKLSTLRNSLMQYSEVRDVSFSLNTPSATINKWWSRLKHRSFAGDIRTTEVKFVDSAYFKLYEIQRLAGTLDIVGDSATNVVVNEAMVKEIGIQDPQKALGEVINFYDHDATIVGVVKDFNTLTLHEGMHPVLLTRYSGALQKVSVKIDMHHSAEAIAHLSKHWKEAFPDYYFTYAFLDEQLTTFYKEEEKMGRLLVAFAAVAVGIGCVGLLGVIMFAAAQRAKEIGIRKILGASIPNIISLLSRDFLRLVFIAAIISWPLAWYAMDQWLESFANKISLLSNSWTFALAGFLALLFALITVGTQALRAALINPTESLRNE